jgi:hypothetical protein
VLPGPSVEVKNAWRYTSTHQQVFMAWCSLKHRDNFTFTFQTNVEMTSSNRPQPRH